ncbi:MAG: metallophosphoesterase family protein [Candidatus Brocadiia bacterium]
MRFLVLADIGDLRWTGGAVAADAVLSCGDVADEVVVAAAEACGGSRVFAVRGNHDRAVPFPSPIRDVHLQVAELGELTVGGFQGCWRYKPRGRFLYSQDEVAAALEHFPAVDIFVAHNSPRGIHDRDDAVHVGFEAFVAYIERCRPRLFVHGHQHLARETRVGDTRVVGVHGHRLVEVQ